MGKENAVTHKMNHFFSIRCEKSPNLMVFICSFFSRFILKMNKKKLLSCAHTLSLSLSPSLRCRQFDLIEQQIIYAIEINVRDFGVGCMRMLFNRHHIQQQQQQQQHHTFNTMFNLQLMKINITSSASVIIILNSCESI